MDTDKQTTISNKNVETLYTAPFLWIVIANTKSFYFVFLHFNGFFKILLRSFSYLLSYYKETPFDFHVLYPQFKIKIKVKGRLLPVLDEYHHTHFAFNAIVK